MSETPPSETAPSGTTPYRGGEVAHLVLAKAARAVAKDLEDAVKGKTVLLTADAQLVYTFAVARQVEAAIAYQTERAQAVLDLEGVPVETTPSSESNVHSAFGEDFAEAAASVLEIAKSIWTEAIATLTPTTVTLAKEHESTDFETIAAVLAAFDPATSVIVDDARVPSADAAPLPGIAVLRQKLSQLEGKRAPWAALMKAGADDVKEGWKQRIALLEAMIDETSAFLGALLAPGKDGATPPLVVAVSRLGVVPNSILVVRPAKTDLHQTTITLVASAPQYIVDAFARIPYVLVTDTVDTAAGTAKAGVGTGAVRYRATFGRDDTIAEWQEIDDVQKASRPPRAITALQAAAAAIAAFVLIAGFSLPFTFTVNRTVKATNEDAITLNAQPLAAESWWQMLLLLAPVAICLLTLAFRSGRRGFIATAVGTLLLVVVAVLQCGEFLKSQLLVIGLGTVLPAVLLLVAAILLLTEWRSGAPKEARQVTTISSRS